MPWEMNPLKVSRLLQIHQDGKGKTNFDKLLARFFKNELIYNHFDVRLPFAFHRSPFVTDSCPRDISRTEACRDFRFSLADSCWSVDVQEAFFKVLGPQWASHEAIKNFRWWKKNFFGEKFFFLELKGAGSIPGRSEFFFLFFIFFKENLNCVFVDKKKVYFKGESLFFREEKKCLFRGETVFLWRRIFCVELNRVSSIPVKSDKLFFLI